MSWEMHPKEFKSVSSLPPPGLYDYFVKRVADWEAVWSLADEEGWILAVDDEGQEIVPVWPHERFADACAGDEWAKGRSRSIHLRDWMERWIPGMIEDGRMVAVFPTPGGKGVVVDPEQLKDDLEAELALIE